MSACRVNEEHIRCLVTAWVRCGVELQTVRHDGDADKTGAMLWAENYASVSHRYSESEVAPVYVHRSVPLNSIADSAVRICKLIDCYEYQSCEHPGWEASEARKWCDRLRGEVCGLMRGYDEASWSARGEWALIADKDPNACAEGAVRS